MKPFESKHVIALLGILVLAVTGCASNGSKPKDQQFGTPQTVTSEPDKSLYTRALTAQNKGQFESAVKLWQEFLSKHPDSFEGHNNLGLVYYSQDKLSHALPEFETAYRLNPSDPKIRKNLARSLRFKANMIHENREYFKTLEILARLEKIVEPEEKQAVLFKQEQVEDQIFLQVIKADNSAAYQDFVNRFPDGLNAVRAREYLEKHPYKVSKNVSQRKSWISSGKSNKDPSGGSSWASADQPPQYGSSKPTAIYTPPPAGAKKKKSGDFFGSDSAAVEDVAEESVATEQAMDPVAAIPFEDFEKPERADEELTRELADTKESRMAAGEFNPVREEPNEGLDTLPDLTPSPVTALSEEQDAPQVADAPAGDIIVQSAEPEQAATAVEEVEASPEAESTASESAESENDMMAQILKEEIPAAENAQPEPVQPEPVQEIETEQETISEEKPMEEVAASTEAESTASESDESESERIARIVREEIAKEESTQQEQVEPSESTQEAEPQEIPLEESLEVATFDPKEQDTNPEAAPAESTPVEEDLPEPDSEIQQQIDQETVSETVAALIPTPPSATAIETPKDSAAVPEASSTQDTANTMVVVQMGAGSTLNVRSEPSVQGEILGYLENGDMMPFMSESGGWYQIEIEEGLSGWVSKKYSILHDDVPAVASSSSEESSTDSELVSEDTEFIQQPSGTMVIVTVSEGSTLNVRSMPSSSGAIVDMLFGGDKLPLVKEKDGWYQVQFEDETTGWISKEFSRLEGEAIQASMPAPNDNKPKRTSRNSPNQKEEMVTTVVVIKVPEGSSLNVRSAPSSQGQVMGILKRGDMRPLLEELDEWYQVELQNGQSGWVSQKFSGKMSLDSTFLQNP